MSELALTLPRMRKLKRPPARLVATALDVLGGCLWTLVGVVLIARYGVWLVFCGVVVGGCGCGIALLGSLMLVLVYIPVWLEGGSLRPVTRREWLDTVFYVLLGALLLPGLAS